VFSVLLFDRGFDFVGAGLARPVTASCFDFGFEGFCGGGFTPPLIASWLNVCDADDFVGAELAPPFFASWQNFNRCKYLSS
jgi:hypothetical protein